MSFALSFHELLEITWRSLVVSGSALCVVVALGVPLGALLGLYGFRGRKFAFALVNTGMGLPPVLVGLVVALLLFRGGPLGFLDWMYTTEGMVLAQCIIALPIIVGLTAAGLAQLEPRLVVQLRALGATERQVVALALREARQSVLAAIMAGFGGALSEVGAVMMVGGNIRHQTRVLTGAIVQHTRMGEFGAAVLLGLVLLGLAFAINLYFTLVQQRGRRR